MQKTPRSSADVVFVVDKPIFDTDLALADIGLNYSDITRYCQRVGFPVNSAALVAAAACPSATEGAYMHCAPHMDAEIRRLNPKVVIPVGRAATTAVITKYWRHAAELQDRWYGYTIPDRSLNAWICPVGIANEEGRNTAVSQTWLYRWLKTATAIQERPWADGSASPESTLNLIEDPDQVDAVLKAATKAPVVAFDYETTGRKPEWSCHRVYSLGLAWTEGDEIKTYAFTIQPRHYPAVRAFLTSRVPKIAANMKFEDRWGREIFGVQTKNWVWDTMLASHWANPMMGTKGHKFLAYAHLGVPYYAGEVEPYFESTSNSTINKIFQVPVTSLLHYNGMDAATELILASMQMIEGGIRNEHIVPDKYLPRLSEIKTDHA